jgi:hypothetical protein
MDPFKRPDEVLTPVIEATFKAEVTIDHVVKGKLVEDRNRFKAQIEARVKQLPELRQAAAKAAEAVDAMLAKLPPNPVVVKFAEAARDIRFDEYVERKDAFPVKVKAQLVAVERKGLLVSITTSMDTDRYHSCLAKTVQRALLPKEREAVARKEAAFKALNEIEAEVLQLNCKIQELATNAKRDEEEWNIVKELIQKSPELAELVRVTGRKQIAK